MDGSQSLSTLLNQGDQVFNKIATKPIYSFSIRLKGPASAPEKLDGGRELPKEPECVNKRHLSVEMFVFVL